MASQTPNLGLILPANGEYTNVWDQPLNENFQIIDTSVGANTDELASAAGSASDLTARLAVSMNSDGSLIATPEVSVAENSPVYGQTDDYTGSPALGPRINNVDFEVFGARLGATSLSGGLAQVSFDGAAANSIVSAPTGFLTATGNTLSLNGSTAPVLANIGGYRQIVSTILTSAVSGAAGTYYVTLAANLQATFPGGVDYLTVTGNTGSTSLDPNDGLVDYFVDTTQDFVSLGVKPGDVLTVTSPSTQVTGMFIVTSVVSMTTLQIIGIFQAALSSLNYTLTSPFQPTLGYTTTQPTPRYLPTQTQPGSITIGQFVFDGTNINSLVIYAQRGFFEQWYPVTLTGGVFSQVVSHNLGFIPSSVEFYGSQTGDYLSPLTPLVNDANTTGTRSVIADLGTVNPASPANLSLTVNTAASGLFYTDIQGNANTSGFLLVRAVR